MHDLAEQMIAFSTTETHQPLSAGFRRVADALKRIGEIDAGLATAECVTLADPLAYASSEAKEAKVSIQSEYC